MRGVVSAGMVAALENLGLRDSFDAVYGSSAGAICGAYFVASQARYGTTIFYENINNRKFVDLWRLIGKKPVVSLEYLLYDVCIRQKPIKFDQVLESNVPLHVVASSLKTKCAVSFTDFSSNEELLEALKGSARIPYFAGPPVPFRGDLLLDASVYESIPFRTALLSKDVTDVVVLLTRPIGDLRSQPNWIDRNVVVPHLRKIDNDIADHYLDRALAYKSELGFINERTASSVAPYFVSIQPPATASKVSPLETDRSALVQGAVDGYRAVYSTFGESDQQLVEIITPFQR